ncbi:MAG TPA: ABC transporter substrate-binding protein [Verrucomicrobiae bacterium]|nr:ABC transporter substrate-binding protein [Verrucomicrobiae bacterium]
MRIASLVPSATEICFALGLGPLVVGVTHACDFPPQATFKPILTHPGDAGHDPGDGHLDEGRHTGSSPIRLDRAALGRARPDLILTQELCDICAVAYTEVRDAARVLPGRPTVLSLTPSTLPEVFRTFLEVAQLTGTNDRARELVGSLAARVDAVRGAVAGRNRPRVVCLEWFDPLMVAGHWVPDQVEIAGGRDVMGSSGAPSRVVTAAEVAAAEPELVVCMPCGLRAPAAQAAAAVLGALPGWGELPAVLAGRVFAVDGSWYFNRPGPRVVDGTELLVRLLHPEAWRGPVPLGTLRVERAPD